MLHACLYTICFEFYYTSWHFYAFSGTNLLTRCKFPIFCYFCILEKLHRKYSRNWTKQKPNLLFLPASRRPKMRQRGARSQAHHGGARPSPWPHHPMVKPGGPPPDVALLTIKFSRQEKPMGWISFPRNILQAAAVVIARSGGSRSSSWHPAGEENPCRRPSPPP
jgi:hypothetical protein